MSSHWVRVVCSIGLRVMWVRSVVGRWGERYIGVRGFIAWLSRRSEMGEVGLGRLEVL